MFLSHKELKFNLFRIISNLYSFMLCDHADEIRANLFLQLQNKIRVCMIIRAIRVIRVQIIISALLNFRTSEPQDATM